MIVKISLNCISFDDSEVLLEVLLWLNPWDACRIFHIGLLHRLEVSSSVALHLVLCEVLHFLNKRLLFGVVDD